MEFPWFRQQFVDPRSWAEAETLPSSSGSTTVANVSLKGDAQAPRNGGARILRMSLGKLDLTNIGQQRAENPDHGPSTEMGNRRQKLLEFESQCNKVDEGLYVSSELVAKNRELLRLAGITHVVNTIGFICPNMFPDELSYLLINILDSPQEDILPVLYDVFDFIESAISAGGNVLVHCSQGVSRSTALAIAYMMWKHGHSYEDTFNVVKQARGVANPNIGFTCQLLHWHKRRMQALAPLHGPRPVSPATQQPLPRARLYRIAAFSVHNPTYLVAKPGPTSPGVSALDTRGIFVVHTAAKVYIWVGRRARQDYLGPALRAATQLAKYEGASTAREMVEEGAETPAFLLALQHPGPLPAGWTAEPVEAYTPDYDMYADARPEAGASPRSIGRSESDNTAGRPPAVRTVPRMAVPIVGIAVDPLVECRRVFLKGQAEMMHAPPMSERSRKSHVSESGDDMLAGDGLDRGESKPGAWNEGHLQTHTRKLQRSLSDHTDASAPCTPGRSRSSRLVAEDPDVAMA